MMAPEPPDKIIKVLWCNRDGIGPVVINRSNKRLAENSLGDSIDEVSLKLMRRLLEKPVCKFQSGMTAGGVSDLRAVDRFGNSESLIVSVRVVINFSNLLPLPPKFGFMMLTTLVVGRNRRSNSGSYPVITMD